MHAERYGISTLCYDPPPDALLLFKNAVATIVQVTIKAIEQYLYLFINWMRGRAVRLYDGSDGIVLPPQGDLSFLEDELHTEYWYIAMIPA